MFSVGSTQGTSSQNGTSPIAGATAVNYEPPARRLSLPYQRIPSKLAQQ